MDRNKEYQMNLGRMMEKARTIAKNTDNLPDLASELWQNLMAAKSETKEKSYNPVFNTENVAKLFVYGCALSNINLDKGWDWMKIAQVLSKELEEDPKEFYYATIRELNNAINEIMENKQ